MVLAAFRRAMDCHRNRNIFTNYSHSDSQFCEDSAYRWSGMRLNSQQGVLQFSLHNFQSCYSLDLQNYSYTYLPMREAATSTHPPFSILIVTGRVDHLSKSRRTEDEVQAIRDALKPSIDAGKISLKDRLAVKTSGEMQRAIQEQKLDFLHICSHGDGLGNLEFDKEHVSLQNIANGLLSMESVAQSIVIAACNLGAHECLHKVCRYLIGCDRALNDAAAVEFAKGFYARLNGQLLEGKIDIDQCFFAGHSHIEASPAGAEICKTGHHLRKLREPAGELRSKLRPVKWNEEAAKCQTLFRENREFKGKTAGVVAEFVAMIKVFRFEHSFAESLTAVRNFSDKLRQLRRFSKRAIISLPTVNTTQDNASETETLVDTLTNSLISAIRVLLDDAKKAIELSPLKPHVSNRNLTVYDEVEILRACLLCKFDTYEDASSLIYDFCDVASEFLSIDENPTLIETARVTSLSNEMFGLATRLLSVTTACLNTRYERTNKASLHFSHPGTTSARAITQFVKSLPHYEEGQKPGETLWSLDEQ